MEKEEGERVAAESHSSGVTACDAKWLFESRLHRTNVAVSHPLDSRSNPPQFFDPDLLFLFDGAWRAGCLGCHDCRLGPRGGPLFECVLRVPETAATALPFLQPGSNYL